MSIIARIEGISSSVLLHESGNASIDFHIKKDSSIKTKNFEKSEECNEFSSIHIDNGGDDNISLYMTCQEDYDKLSEALLQSRYNNGETYINAEELDHIIDILEDFSSTGDLRDMDKELLQRLIDRKKVLT